jgi:putative endonuclease
MKQQFGQQGEQFVVNYLKKEKFKILEQNYKQFFGEIDIIARKENTLAFIEVKTRHNSKISLFQLVSFTKQQKIIKTAKKYISEHCKQQQNITFRFDVALVHFVDTQPPELSYIPNAF